MSAKEFSHLAQFDLADNRDSRSPLEVDVLIGSDQYWDIVAGETIRGRCGPVAIVTRFGWVLSGPTKHVGSQSSVNLMITHTLNVNTAENEESDAALKSFWELESLGIHGQEDLAYGNFMNDVQLRYEVSLPWCEYHESLPDNYDLSLRSLQGLFAKAETEPSYFERI